MEERRAARVVETWSGGDGLVPRGPRLLLGWAPAVPEEVQRNTGRRPPPGQRAWRLQVGGRFLRSGGLVYPGGVPFPEDLRSETAVVCSEVWLYVTEPEGRVLGLHWWPEAVRRPIAAKPEGDFDHDDVLHPAEAAARLDMPLPLPAHPRWEPALAVLVAAEEALLLCIRDIVPDPLNEMLLYEQGGLSLRVRRDGTPPGLAGLLHGHEPPFRRVRVGRGEGIGREPGRSLGPQTWPWPGELLWWADGLAYELKGFQPLAELIEVAETVRT